MPNSQKAMPDSQGLYKTLVSSMNLEHGDI